MGGVLICEAITAEGEGSVRMNTMTDVRLAVGPENDVRLAMVMLCGTCGCAYDLDLHQGAGFHLRLTERINLGKGSDRPGLN